MSHDSESDSKPHIVAPPEAELGVGHAGSDGEAGRDPPAPRLLLLDRAFEGDDFENLLAIYKYLATLDKPEQPARWPDGPATKHAKAFLRVFKPLASTSKETLQEEDLRRLDEARSHAASARQGILTFTVNATERASLEAKPPPAATGPNPLVAGAAIAALPSAAAAGPDPGCTPGGRACEGCRAAFDATVLTCPMCDGALTPRSEALGDGVDLLWWERETPGLRIPFVDVAELGEHLGQEVFVRVAALHVPQRHDRPLDMKVVAAIHESLTVGRLLSAIGVSAEGCVCYGQHRHAAHRLSGRTWIRAWIYNNSAASELAGLVENLCRRNVSILERFAAFVRMKELYLELHPETKHGAAGARARHGLKMQTTNMSSASFAKTLAEDIGVTPRHAQRWIETGKKLRPEAVAILETTRKAKNNATQLLAVAKALTLEEQVALAKNIAATESSTAPKVKEPRALVSGSAPLSAEGEARIARMTVGARTIVLRILGDALTWEEERRS